MAGSTLEADYVIVGAGAVAMAFADTLLSDGDATMIVVASQAQTRRPLERRVPVRSPSRALCHGQAIKPGVAQLSKLLAQAT